MYLARRANGNLARVYEVDTNETAPRAWRFQPPDGEAGFDARSFPARQSGFAVLHRTANDALAALAGLG